MERVHFHRKESGLIIVRVNHKQFKGGRFNWSTSQTVSEQNWENGTIKRDKPTQCITTYPTMRRYFDAIKTVCINHLSGHINADRLKTDLSKLTRTHLPEPDGFFETYEKIINTTQIKGKPITDGTKRSKRQSMHKLLEYAPDLTFQSITIDFYHQYTVWLRERTPKTVGKHIKELKAIMREAEDRGYPVCQDYKKKKFAVERPTKDSTFLTMEEIEKVYKADVAANLVPIRDMFVIACLTGQRIGDWHQLSPNNLEDGLLKVVQEKTGGTVYIPVHNLVRIIWNKYNGLPKLLSDQKFNELIKEVCEKAKLGKIMVDGELQEKSEHISSHTARRSFASNAFLAGMDTLSIRKFTGHKSESSFLKYIRLDERQHGKKAGEHEFFTNTITMKAAS